MLNAIASAIAGDGLGFSYSSLNQIGEILPSAPFGSAKLKIFFNLNNGNLVVEDHIAHIIEQPTSVDLGFVYNSQIDNLRQTWRLKAQKQFKSLPPHNSFSNQTAILIEGDGHETTYHYDEEFNVFRAPGLNNGTPYFYYDATYQIWLWYHPGTQLSEIYDLTGKLQQCRDREGHTTTFQYDAQGNLYNIVGSAGYQYQIRRSDNSVAIYVIDSAGPENLIQTHQFDHLGRLTATLMPDDYRIDYEYTADTHLLTQIRQSDQTTIRFRYQAITDLFKVTSIDGGNIDAETRSHMGINYDNASSIIIEDGIGIKTWVHLDNKSRVDQIKREIGYDQPSNQYDITQFDYTENNQVATVQHSNGGMDEYYYTQGLLNLLSQHIQPDGQIHQYYYENSLQPALISKDHHLRSKDQIIKLLITRYVYDVDFDRKNQRHKFLRFEISPTGRVIEYRPTESGNIKTKRIYLVNNIDLSDYPPDEPITLQQMQLWILQQDQKQVQLIEFTYDNQGQVETLKCYTDVDEYGNGIDNETMGFEYNFWTYFGNIYEQGVKQSGNKLAYVHREFDSLQRMWAEHNPLNEYTLYQYQDNLAKVSKIYPNGLLENHQYDSQQQEQFKEEIIDEDGTQQIRKTCYERDYAGRVVITIHPDGHQVFSFFDRQNRLGFIVTATGIVTQYSYDNSHRFKTITHYNHRIDPKDLYQHWPPKPAELPDVNNLIQLISQIQDPQNDRTEYEFYNFSGKIRYRVDAKQYVTEIIYDSLIRSIAKIRYQSALSQTQLNILLEGNEIFLTPDFNQDRCELTFYDDDNLKIAEIDAAGYVTTFIRGAAGWIKETILYATPLLISQQIQILQSLTHQPVQHFIEKNPTKDKHTYFYYNRRGQCIAELKLKENNTDGTSLYYYVAHTILAGGLPSSSIHYATPVILSPSNLEQDLPLPPEVNSEDRMIVHQYDLLNREIQKDEAFGKTTIKEFDDMGNLISHTVQDFYIPGLLDADHYRAHFYRYDGFGQNRAEINPYSAQQVAEINANNTLTPQQKIERIEWLWQTKSTRDVFDMTGLKLKVITAEGGITYFYYDNERRPVVTVDAIGAVKENHLNSFSEIIATRLYKNPIPDAQLKTLTGGFLQETFRTYLNSLQSTDDAVTMYQRDQRGQIIAIIDPENYLTTRTYSAFKQCIIENIPISGKNPSLTILHAFEQRGLETLISKQTAAKTVITKKSYHNSFGKQTDLIDPLNRHSKIEYDRFGNSEKEIDAENIIRVTRTYDAFQRPIKETNSLGATTIHHYDQRFRLHKINHPQPDTSDTFITNVMGETVEHQDGLHHIEQWQHAHEGQIRVYIDFNEDKQFDFYDMQGRHIGHRDANQVSTEYRLNKMGYLTEKIYDPSGLNLHTFYETDAWGHNEVIIDPNKVIHNNSFDRRGLIVQTILDPQLDHNIHLNLVTTKNYNGQGTLISEVKGDISDLEQYNQIWIQDEFNRYIGKTVDPNGLALTESQHLDVANQIIAKIDQNNHITRYFYDNCGRKRYKVNPLGEVKEWFRDTEGKVIFTREYVIRIDAERLTDQTTTFEISQTVISDQQDTLLWFFYDSNGQEVFRINSVGAISEKHWNLAGKLIIQIDYATPIDLHLIPQLTTETLYAWIQSHFNVNDRYQYYKVDAKGQRLFVIDAEGYITQNIFDKVGRTITTTQYATRITNLSEFTQLNQKNVAQQIPLDALNDRSTYYIFDSRGKPWFVVNGEGAVTRFLHDGNGNLIEECAFADVITAPSNYNQLTDQLKTLTPDGDKDHITFYKNDAANRCYEKIDSLGNSDQFQFDALGNLIQHRDRCMAVWVNRFDRANRKINEYTPAYDVTWVNRSTKTGKLLTETQIIAVEKKIEYDPAGNQTVIISGNNTPEMRTLITVYNEVNRVISTVIPNALLDDPAKPAGFIDLPEIQQDIFTNIIYNAKGLPISYQNENGFWEFKIYDAEKYLLYKIDAAGFVIEIQRNIFGEVICEIEYAIAIKIDLSLYIEIGIPINLIKQNLITDSDDRVTFYQRDHRGDIIAKQIGNDQSLFYYNPSLDENSKPTFGYYCGITHREYNAFQELIAQTQLINAELNTWNEKIEWRNRTGKIIAMAEKIGQVEGTLRYQMARLRLNVYDKPIVTEEFATPITSFTPLRPQTPIVEIDKLIIRDLTKDRIKTIEYNLLNKETKEILLNQIVQTLIIEKNDKPQIKDLPLQDIVRSYDYNAREQCITTTHTDGSKEYRYFNAAGFLIAETGITRDSFNQQGELIKLTPLTYYLINSFGQKAEIIRFKEGTSHHLNPDDLPKPLQRTTEDQHEITLFNERGKIRIEQDAKNSLKINTYDGKGNNSRHFFPFTQWMRVANEFNVMTHIDSKCVQYDPVDNPVYTSLLRNNKIQQITALQFNAFHEAITEGSGDGIYPLIRKYNSQKKIWHSNEDGGVHTLFFYDLLGNQTAKIQSATKDLSQITYEQLSEIAAQYQNEKTKNQFTYEFTENFYDLINRVRAQLMPAYFDVNHHPLLPIPLSMTVGKQYAADFGSVSISWITPQEKNVQIIFSLKPSNTKMAEIQLPIITKHGRSGVDVSHLSADVYTYQIDYFFIHPIDHSRQKLYYTQGEIQLGGNSKESHNLVVHVKNDNQLVLSGNTQDLTGIELWQNNQKVNCVAVQPIAGTDQFIADLSHFVSGFYSVKPIISGQVKQQNTLPFIIYTSKVSSVPLSREIIFEKRTLLYISPSPCPNIISPNLEFLDTRLDRQACWTNITIFAVNSSGILLDVTALAPGHYPYRINNTHEQTFVVTHQNDVYPSNDFPKTAADFFAMLQWQQNDKLVHPIRYFELDRWNNITALTDTLGHTTYYDYNARNQLQKITTPPVSVVKNNNTVTVTPIVIVTGHNIRGFNIGTGVINDEGMIERIEANQLNQAGQCLKLILGNGTEAEQRAFDALGRIPFRWDSRGKCWQQMFDHNNKPIARITPKGNSWIDIYNEQNLLIASADPLTHVRRYNYDINHNVSTRFEPGGDTYTVMTWDRSHHPLSEVGVSPSGVTESIYHCNYFGIVKSYFVNDGCSYFNIYNYKGELTVEKSFGALGKHGWMLQVIPHQDSTGTYYTAQISLTPDKHLTYQYRVGQLIQVIDQSVPNHQKITQYHIDSENRRMGEQLFHGSQLIRTVHTWYDPLGAQKIIRDANLTLFMGFDGSGLVRNRRHISAFITDILVQEHWNYFNEANQIINDNGIEYGYEENNRKTCFRMSQPPLSYFTYDDDGLLITMTYFLEISQRNYNAAGLQISYATSTGIFRQTDYNANGWQIFEMQQATHQPQIKTTFSNFLSQGLPLHQETSYWCSSENTTYIDELDISYLNFSHSEMVNLQVASIGGTRTNTNTGEKSPYAIATLFADPNGAPNSSVNTETSSIATSKNNSREIVCVENDSIAADNLSLESNEEIANEPPPIFMEGFTLFNSHYTGITLSKKYFTSWPWEPIFSFKYKLVGEDQYFYTPDGGYLGSYGSDGVSLDYEHYVPTNAGTLAAASNASASSQFFLADPTPPIRGANFPAPGGTYIVVEGDTWETISIKLYGDPGYAQDLENANNDQLFPGQQLNIPQFIPTHNNTQVNNLYQRFVSHIIGNLSPVLQTPLPKLNEKEGFFGEAFHFAVEAIAVAVGTICGVITGPLGDLLGAVSAAMMDCLGQELEIALRFQRKFSWKEAVEVGLSEAVMAARLPYEGIGGSLLNAAKNVTAQQLTGLMLGTQNKLDLTAIASAMTAASAEYEMDLDLNLDPNTMIGGSVNNVVGNALSDALTEGKNFDVESWAAQVIGDESGILVQHALTPTPAIKTYQKSLNASLGNASSNDSRNIFNTITNSGSKISPTSQNWQFADSALDPSIQQSTFQDVWNSDALQNLFIPSPGNGQLSESIIPSNQNTFNYFYAKMVQNFSPEFQAALNDAMNQSLAELKSGSAWTLGILSGIDAVAQRYAPTVNRKITAYTDRSVDYWKQSMQASSNLFFNTDPETTPLLEQEFDASNEAYEYNVQRLAKANLVNSGITVIENLNKISFGIEMLDIGVDVLNAQTPEAAAKAAYVDSFGVIGGNIGNRVGIALALGEEIESLGLLTPLAVGTVAAFTVGVTALLKGVGVLSWDFDKFVNSN